LNGCKAIVELQDLGKHETCCEHNPESIVVCKQGCGVEMQRKALENHNCVAHLRFLIEDLALSRPLSQSSQFCGSVYDEINSINNQIRDFKKRLDDTIDRLNESLPKKSNSNTRIERSESTQSTNSNHSLLDFDGDSFEKVGPPVKPQ
jgi:hypothetical protein